MAQHLKPNRVVKSTEDDEQLYSPIILTGRGGSGTRLLSNLALHCDIFLGNDLNDSLDSIEWVDLLYDISIEKVTATKSTEGAFATRWKTNLLQKAQKILKSGNVRPDQIWGWKLPESMLIIPELFSVFKNAKLVHLTRHPVSSSIRRTHKTSRSGNLIGKTVLENSYQLAGVDPAAIASDNDYRKNALTWCYQVDQVVDYAKLFLPDEQYLHITYEDLCRNPDSEGNRLARFTNTHWKDGSTTPIDPQRIREFGETDPQVQEVWELCKSVAAKAGYNSIVV